MLRSVGLILGLVASSALAATPTYVATPLGTLGGITSAGYSINANGDVTGYADTGLPLSRALAFLYSGGAIHDLGSIQGPYSYGLSINLHDQVVGYGVTGNTSPTGDPFWLAFLYSDGVMQDIGTLGGGGAQATGINDQGQVVGWSYTQGNTAIHAFIYATGTMKDLGTLPGGVLSKGYAINASGQVTGQADRRAFLYSQGTMRDLGTIPSNPQGDSMGFAINDHGDVTGIARTYNGFEGPNEGPYHAFLYTNGAMQDLGNLEPIGDVSSTVSYGLGMNNARQVVGFNTNSAGVYQRAFLYTDGAMFDLNQLVVSGLGTASLIEARDINDNGQIVATGCGAIPTICQAFRLDPVSGPPEVHTPVSVVEYYYAAFDHYFMTADSAEISALDTGAVPGWVRTGQSFKAYIEPTVGAAQVCRFFNDSFAPKSSHFYSADPNECLYLKIDPLNWEWQFEGITMYIPTPDSEGNCVANTQPVYRLYNNGMGGAPSHRYTASLSIRDQMIGQGWVSEGYGPAGVIMCAPQ